MSQPEKTPQKSPPAACGKTNRETGSHIEAPCEGLSVIYAFQRAKWDNASSSERSIRFDVAVAVNGKVISVGGKEVTTMAAGEVVSIASVAKGDKVGLYFHHDAQATHPVTGKPMRKYLLWEVELGDHPAYVTIKEKRGRINAEGKLTRGKLASPGKGSEQVQYYEGTLDGNVWLNSTRRYDGESASQALDIKADARLRNALITFFDAKVTETHKMAKDKQGKAVQGEVTGVTFIAMLNHNLTIEWPFSENCTQNIVGFTTKHHIQTVHPQTVLAILEAMVASDIHTVKLSSGWRPLLGSMQHRDGTGLDVVSITYFDQELRKDKTIALNRKALGANGLASDTDTVSKDEYDKFGPIRTKQQKEDEYLALTKTAIPKAAKEAKDAGDLLNAKLIEVHKQSATTEARHAALAADIQAKEAKYKLCQAKLEALERKRVEYTKEMPDVVKASNDARSDWEKNMDEHMPPRVRTFRQSLLLSSKVRQVLDPWYLDINTTDNQDGHITQKANDQTDDLKKLHNNHLHVGARHAQAQ